MSWQSSTHSVSPLRTCRSIPITGSFYHHTPGRGKIVPRNIIYNIMFEYLGLAYRDSDYTAVITIMH